MFVLDLNKVHSYVDIITNSSTVIYTWSEGSVEKAKDLLRVMFDLFGEKDVDIEKDFIISSLPTDRMDYWGFSECVDDFENLELAFGKQSDYGSWNDFYKEASKYLDELLKNFLENKPVPKWYSEQVEEWVEQKTWHESAVDTNLVIIPKDKKYKELAEKMVAFLYSTNHDGWRDG